MQRPHNTASPDACPVEADPMDELTAVYLAAVHRDVANLQAALDEAGRDPSRRTAALEEMREITHNVKGQGASFGYPLMTRVGESLSALLKLADADDPMLHKLAAAHVQALRLVLAQDIKGDGGAQGAALIERLTTLVAGYATPPAPPAATP